VLFVRRIFSSTVYPEGFKKIALPKEFITGVLRIILEVVCKCLLFCMTVPLLSNLRLPVLQELLQLELDHDCAEH